MSRVKKLREAEGRNRTLSPDECSRLLKACAKSSNKLLLPFVILALTTGARSGELLSLQWNAVDLENGLIHLKSTKNGRPRVLAIVGDVLEMLKDLFAKKHPEKSLVFASKTRFGQLTLRKPWEKALKEATIEDFRVHDLRHCFATIASVSGTSNIQLSAATGHRTLSQLLRYCHPDAASVQQLTNKVYEKLVNTTNLSEIIASDPSPGANNGSD
jgi:integrase